MSPVWAGILGGFLGMIAGQAIIYWITRDIPRQELLTNRSIKIRYGLMGWAISLLGAGVGLLLTLDPQTLAF